MSGRFFNVVVLAQQKLLNIEYVESAKQKTKRIVTGIRMKIEELMSRKVPLWPWNYNPEDVENCSACLVMEKHQAPVEMNAYMCPFHEGFAAGYNHAADKLEGVLNV